MSSSIRLEFERGIFFNKKIPRKNPYSMCIPKNQNGFNNKKKKIFQNRKLVVSLSYSS